MPTNDSIILKSVAFAVLLAQAAAAQKVGGPPVAPPRGPFTCTKLMGLYSSGEWWDRRLLRWPWRCQDQMAGTIRSLRLYVRIRQTGQLYPEPGQRRRSE